MTYADDEFAKYDLTEEVGEWVGKPKKISRWRSRTIWLIVVIAVIVLILFFAKTAAA